MAHAPTIKIEPAGEKDYSANPLDRLGEEFTTYLGVCRAVGLRYDQQRRRQVGSLSTLPRMVAELERAGFLLVVAPELRAAVDAQAKVHEDAAAVGSDRAQQAQERAAARGLQLYPFQVEGVRWLAPRKAALLADEMGLGKTVQAVCALDAQPALLVVAPALVKGNWSNEVRRWCGLPVHVCNGRGSFRWPQPGECVVVNYDILPGVPEEVPFTKRAARTKAGTMPAPLVGPAHPVTVVADEAHAVKNAQALRTTRFRAVAREAAAADGRVWLLTGTPLLNHPGELWQLLEAAGLSREAFGSWPNFCRLFGGRKGRNGYEWGTPSPEVPMLLRRVALVRRRLDVLPQLPRKTRQDIEVEIDSATRKVCDEALAQLRAAGIDLASAQAVVDETKLQGAEFDALARARAALAQAKLPAMLAVVEEYEEQGTPLVVFSYHTAAAKVLGTRPGWATITGSTPAEERTAIVARFQAGELLGIVGTIQAMGVGVTLTRAAHALFVDLAWTPALNSQAEDRICRIGQEASAVLVQRLVADHPVDYRVCELLTKKQRIIEGSVDASAVGVVDQAAIANNEALARAAQLAGIFRSAAVVDEATARQAKVQHEQGVQAQVQQGLPRRAAADQREADAYSKALAGGHTGPCAAALAHYGQRDGQLNALEWAVLVHMVARAG